MYYSHFGLSQAPFKITPNTEFFFAGGNRGPILEALIYAIPRRGHHQGDRRGRQRLPPAKKNSVLGVILNGA